MHATFLLYHLLLTQYRADLFHSNQATCTMHPHMEWESTKFQIVGIDQWVQKRIQLKSMFNFFFFSYQTCKINRFNEAWSALHGTEVVEGCSRDGVHLSLPKHSLLSYRANIQARVQPTRLKVEPRPTTGFFFFLVDCTLLETIILLGALTEIRKRTCTFLVANSQVGQLSSNFNLQNYGLVLKL